MGRFDKECVDFIMLGWGFDVWFDDVWDGDFLIIVKEEIGEIIIVFKEDVFRDIMFEVLELEDWR